MNKIFLGLFLGIFLISIVGAEEYPQHKQSTDLPIAVTSNNATSCVLTTMQTPTILVLINATMDEQSPKSFNTTILAGNFTDLGNYGFNIVCFDGVGHATGNVWRSVSSTGFNDNLGFYILMLILSMGVILVGFYMSDATIVLLGSFGLYFVGFYTLFNGIDGLRDVTYTWAIGIIVLMLASYISFRAAAEWLN